MCCIMSCSEIVPSQDGIILNLQFVFTEGLFIYDFHKRAERVTNFWVVLQMVADVF